MQPVNLDASEVVVGPGVRFSAGGALARSLVVWRRNLPFLLLVAVLAQLPEALIGEPGPSLSPGRSLLLNAITSIPGPLFLSFQSVRDVVLYEQLRAEKEGADVGQLTAVFE